MKHQGVKSWVIVKKETGVAVMETFDEQLTRKINTDKYKIVPILEYLVNLNRLVKANEKHHD